ncbi:uncharacterized protein LOC111115434 [Crassostrea virginica]
MEQNEGILQRMEEMLVSLGYEIYPFKVGWYNQPIEEKYKLPFPDDTLAVLVISTPDLWEKAFIPFAKNQDLDNWDNERNPLHECMIYHFDQVKQSFPEHDVETVHVFETLNGQARKFVQIAAHVSGAAYYYEGLDDKEQPSTANQKIHGTCYHPVYGGWISIDGVFIFKDVLCSYLEQKAPQDVIPSQEKRAELLDKFSRQDISFRDLLPVRRKYSTDHIEYLSTKDPQKRRDIVQRIKSRCTSLKEAHEIHMQLNHDGSSVDSSNIKAITDLEKTDAATNRKRILRMFPSVLTYIVGKIKNEPVVKVFLKREDTEAENDFRQSFHRHTMQFVNVTKQMEETLQKAPQVKIQTQMDKDIRKRLGEIIESQSRTLLANHSQIIRISAGNMPEGTSAGKPCIVIHCLDKKLIPTGEQELPKELEGYPVCIQEGFVMFGFCDGCETLKNGCSIGRSSDMVSGSIGFFAVRKPGQLKEEKGFLTAAHVALPSINEIYEAKTLFTELNLGSSIHEIVHPSWEDSNSAKTIGKVSEAFCGNYGHSSIGIDAAFVNCYEELGAHLELQIAKENELSFDGSTIVTKTGRTTSTTKGILKSEVSIVQIPNQFGGVFVFENVYSIENLPQPEPTFFRAGDSGSGVYLFEENGKCNKALGIAFAYMFSADDFETYVCKMGEVVKAFNIHDNSEELPIDLE